MKLFFISDLHGCLKATKTALKHFERSEAEHLILLGDVLNHGPRNPIPVSYDPVQVAQLLNQYKTHIIAVRGNCDSEVDQMLLEFPIMSDYTVVLLDSGSKLFLTHGHIYNQQHLPLLNAGDVLCHGHSHIPQAAWVGEHFIFNPGSTTFPRGQIEASYGLYEGDVFRVCKLNGGEEILSGQYKYTQVTSRCRIQSYHPNL
ncbi:phosphodiesterase [Vibrio algivorus]|uniref:Phosphoesterase n=1 Tax=Vibrio algivorus TaxID=1667024 RepID=A0ABQ6ERK8_9VIBR|nr:phosphodiesterase [Vibrio algivorus]GLT15666.1 phosphoesterase [Vibrio algivorus]